MEMKQQIEAALEFKGMSLDGLSFSFLGEGAWYEAYLFSTKEQEASVIRFPKKISYGEPFVYDEQVLLAECAGRGFYYQQANRVVQGICPEDFTYHVQPEMTFTIESYSGRTISLSETNPSQAFGLGRECGELFQGMNRSGLQMEGFGFLEWNEGKLVGCLQEELGQYWREDTEGYREQLEQLLNSGISMNADKVRGNLDEILHFRQQRLPKLTLTNRDVSPENIIVRDNSLCLIDPFPLFYDGDVFAGNLLNNFNTLFPAYYRSPRYEKHQFHLYRDQLSGFAEGFLAGYAQGDKVLRYSVLAEEFLMLLDLVTDHVSLLKDQMNEGQVLRFGNRSAVEERIPGFIQKLEEFAG